MMKNLHCQWLCIIGINEKHEKNYVDLSEIMSVELYFDPQVLVCEISITSILYYFMIHKGR